MRWGANRSGGMPTAVVGFQPLCVIIFCVFEVCAKLQCTARSMCDTSFMRWDANRSGGVPTAVVGFQPLCVIIFCVFEVCAKLQCTARIVCDTSLMRWGANRSGGIPTSCCAGYGVHLELTANALSVEWDAEYAPATDITVTSWLVDTTIHIPFLYVSVKYEIIID